MRGTTSREIVLMAREAGAKKVLFASCAPPITYPHIYGIDLASSTELIAFNKSSRQIAREIGADEVIFQTLPDLQAACAEQSPRRNADGTGQGFEVGVFCGKYVTGVDEGYLEHLEEVRKGVRRDKAKAAGVEVDVKRAKLNGAAKRAAPEGDEEDGDTPGPQDVSLHNFNDYV